MALKIVPYSADLEAAVQRFNQRMVAGNADADFDIPQKAVPPLPPLPVRAEQFLAIDDAGEARGGIILQQLPLWVSGKAEPGLNLQSALSEGIVNKKFSLVAVQMIRWALKQSPYAYIVGMGGEEKPLPRLLRAAGWTVRPVPFYFRMQNPSRCLRELGPLKDTPWRRLVAGAASVSGAGWLGAQILQKGTPTVPAGYTSQSLDAVSGLDDELWNRFGERCSFGVVRNAETLPYYLRSDVERRLILHQGEPCGWISMLVGQRRGDSYFGNLKVGTLIDVVAGEAGAVQPAVALAIQYADSHGCDLLVSNQMHAEVRHALEQTGFQAYRSNYALGTSKGLSERLEDATTLITRQDGGGLTNLTGWEADPG